MQGEVEVEDSQVHKRENFQVHKRSLSLKAGVVPPERHEMQPFRTKWTLDVKNGCKIAILLGPSQPFRTKWTLDVKNQ